jgi:hypothetical protein
MTEGGLIRPRAFDRASPVMDVDSRERRERFHRGRAVDQGINRWIVQITQILRPPVGVYPLRRTRIEYALQSEVGQRSQAVDRGRRKFTQRLD